MPGTDLRYRALSAYALPCTDLLYRDICLHAPYVMPGTDPPYRATRSNRAPSRSRWPLQLPRVPSYAIRLRACYAMS
eukprot:1899495-Rhodomonas_salina.1